MRIGSNRDQSREGVKRIRLREMPLNSSLQARIILGPEIRTKHMFPTMVEDKTSGTLKPSWRAITVNRNEENILDKLAALDIALKQKVAMSKGMSQADAVKEFKRSTLGKNDIFMYAVFQRAPVSSLEIQILEAPWSVHAALMKMRSDTMPGNANMLCKGLLYMYDVIFTRGLNPKTKQPEYGVTTFQCQTEGKIGAKYLDEAANPFPNVEQFFTQEELDAISRCTWDLATIDPPEAPGKVKELLSKFPLSLAHTEKKNQNKFLLVDNMDSVNAYLTYCNQNGVPVVLPSEQELAQAALAASQQFGTNRQVIGGNMALGGQTQNAALPPGDAGSGAVDEAPFDLSSNDVQVSTDVQQPVTANTAFVSPTGSPISATGPKSATVVNPGNGTSARPRGW